MTQPLDDVAHAGAIGGGTVEPGGLALVEAAQDDGGALAIAGVKATSYTLHIGMPQRAIPGEGGVHRAFIPRHAALKGDREALDATCDVLREPVDECLRVGVGIELGLGEILEDDIDHAHIHEKALGGSVLAQRPVVSEPTAVADADEGAVGEGRRCFLGCGGSDPQGGCQANEVLVHERLNGFAAGKLSRPRVARCWRRARAAAW